MCGYCRSIEGVSARMPPRLRGPGREYIVYLGHNAILGSRESVGCDVLPEA